MNELVSVIINVYNGQDFIKKCLDSVINQTYKNLEIIIINDGSTDNTLNILKSYKDKRIKIITTSNQGLSLSRNTGLDNAKGDYLFFVDADDYIENDAIEYLYNLCKKYNVKMSTCNSIDVYDYETKIKNDIELIEVKEGKDLLIKILLSENRKGTIWNKLIKKELFDNLRFENRLINDVVVVYKLALKVDNVVFSNQIKYYYYRHKDSIVAKRNTAWVIDYYNATIERYEHIKKIYPNMIENDICILNLISGLSNTFNKEVDNYLKEQNARKLYNKLFSFKVLKYKLSSKKKLKLVLYRINPNISRLVKRIYLIFKRNKIKTP